MFNFVGRPKKDIGKHANYTDGRIWMCVSEEGISAIEEEKISKKKKGPTQLAKDLSSLSGLEISKKMVNKMSVIKFLKIEEVSIKTNYKFFFYILYKCNFCYRF